MLFSLHDLAAIKYKSDKKAKTHHPFKALVKQKNHFWGFLMKESLAIEEEHSRALQFKYDITA